MTAYNTTVPIHQALADIKRDLGAVGKNEMNQAQGFKFRGVDAVVTAVSPMLKRHGVTALPEVLNTTVEHCTTGKYSTPTKVVDALVRYRFVGPDGDELSATVAAEAMDTGDKATAKAMSVAFRIALLQVFALPTDEPDPDTHTYVRQPAQREPENQNATQQEDHIDWEADLEALAGSYDGLRQLWLAADSAGCSQDYLDRVATAGKKANGGGQ